MSQDQHQDQHQHQDQDQDQRQDQGQDQSEASAAALDLDLDAPAIQGAVYRYLAVVGQHLLRVAEAIATGNQGRRLALEELGTVSVLVHYLRRRLVEPADGGDEGGGGDADAAQDQARNEDEDEGRR